MKGGINCGTLYYWCRHAVIGRTHLLPMLTAIYLVRHGEYENPGGIMPSRLKGFPLSAKGRQDMEQSARLLQTKDIAIIYASPILRTKQSARILSRMWGVPVVFTKCLMEVYAPGIQGKPEAITDEIDQYGDTYQYPPHLAAGGETSEHVYRRVKRFIRKVLAAHKGKSVVFVSHGDPIMVTKCREEGKPVDGGHPLLSHGAYIPKSGIVKLVYEGDRCIEVKNLNF